MTPLVQLETNTLTEALIMTVYSGRRCKNMARIPEGSSEESILFYAWFYAAQIMPGPLREHGLLNAGNLMIRSLTEGGNDAGTPTPE